MERNAQEFRPNVVLASAIYSGLSALVNLAYNRKSSQTIKQYDQIKKIWEKTRREKRAGRKVGSHDYSSVQNVESALRNLYFKMLWKSTRQYGNRESKRVYSWREGTVGPLNALLNFAGAVLRDTLVPRYPFPDPDLYERREYPDGQKRLLPKSVADKIPVEKNVKVQVRAGYRGNSKNPRVLLSHPTLPALDFGDMIRAHLVELCRQCFINNVPRGESQRYIRLLTHRLIPFLDWVYTRGKTGRKNFYPGADEELRKVVLEIRTHFGTQSGREEGISRKIERISSDVGVNFLIEKIESIRANCQEDYIKEKCETILNHIEDGIVTDIDISKFIEEVTQKSAREGNDWHRILLSGFPHPRSLKEVVFVGDTLLQTTAGLQYLAEVPVKGKTGAGKIDLVLFVRTKKREGHYIWTPVLILEIKTKTGFNFNLYGKRPRTKKPQVFVPVLNAWKRSLTEPEWNTMVKSVPPKFHLDQLDAYEDSLLSEYNALIGNTRPLTQLWKGVVTLDVTQDFSSTKRAFDQLVEQLVDRIIEGKFKGQWKTLTTSKIGDESAPSIAITMTPASGDISILKSIEPQTSVNLEDPFKERIEDDTFFTQYVSVPSPTSSGKSAAWLSKNWHLLNHLAELEETSPNNDFVWIDLLGDYPTKRMIEMRFGLDTLRKKNRINKKDHTRLSRMLARIQFACLREETDNFLFENDSTGIEQVREIIQSTSSNTTNRVVVVDGWSDLDKMLPITNRKNLSVLEITLLQILKETAQEVIWIDSGVDHPLMNKTYQRSCVSPLFYSSPRKQVIDEILWNLPTAPRKMGWVSPQYDDSRIIIQDLPTSHPPWITVIHVPYLRGWTKKFSAAAVRSPIIDVTEHLGNLNQQQSMYGRSFQSASIQVRYDAIGEESIDSVKERALTLIPSLRRKQKGDISEDDSADWEISYISVDSEIIQPGLMSRLQLDVNQSPPTPNRSSTSKDIYVDAEHITRGWIHKTPPEDEDTSSLTSRRAPHVYSQIRPDIDTLETRRREIQRIATAAEYLTRTTRYNDSLFREIVSICDYDRSIPVDEGYLLAILQQIRDAILRKNEPRQLWKLLLDTRRNSADLLNTQNQRALRLAQSYNPEILELYGMNLFLAIVSVADKILKNVEPYVCKTLWPAIARWQFYQMGFEQEDDGTFEQRYDFQTIHSNLLWRAKQMQKTTPTQDSRFTEQFGQLLWREGSDDGHSWLLFPSFKNTMFGALLENQMSAYLRQGWYRGVIDPEKVKEKAEDALSREGWNEFSIVLVDVNTQRVLFAKTEGEQGEEWNLVGAFEYGNPPKDQSQPVRWIRLSHPLPETFLALHGFTPGSPPPDISVQCDPVLNEASEWTGVVRDVTCFLTIDIEKKVYKIELLEGSTAIAQKETNSTDDVISFLRFPLRKGEYFSTPDGTYLRWNPMQDIVYDDVATEDVDRKLDPYSLSIFKPLIHRSSFFPDSYALPATCEEFLRTKKGNDITLRIIVDEQKKNIGTKKYLKVQLEGVKKSGLVRFENENMGIFDVALLTECDQFVDMELGRRHNVSINVESLAPLRLAHLLSEFPKLQSIISSHIEDLQLSEADEYEEGVEGDHEYVEPEAEYIEPEFEEGLEEELEYIEPDHDSE